MRLITVIILLAALATVVLVIVYLLALTIALLFINPPSTNASNMSNNVWNNETDSIRYVDPKDIPDCKYLTGKYLFGMQRGREGMTLGYMICEGEKPYHYEMILNNVTTHESYWVKRTGGSV